MLPLAAGDIQIGGDGPSYYPMARALMSGLLFGSVTSLFFVPLFFIVVKRQFARQPKVVPTA